MARTLGPGPARPPAVPNASYRPRPAIHGRTRPAARMAPPGMTTRRLLRDQIERLWNGGELDLVRRNYRADVVDHMPVPGQLGGLDGMEQVVREFRAAMPDLAMELHGVLVDGDRGCDFWTLTGTNTGPLFGRPPTGERVRMSGIDMVRVAGGQVAELWHVEEMARFEAQLGWADAAPDDAVAALRAAAPDLRITIEARVSEGDLVATRWTAEGTHTGAPLLGVTSRGRRFRIAGMEVARAGAPLMQVAELAQARAQLA